GRDSHAEQNRRVKNRTPERSYLLIDGYNIIYAWEDLKELAEDDIGAARDRLLDIMSNYAGFSDENVIVVFDAYRVSGGRGEVFRYHNIDVVYTKEAETADLYIEKTSHELVKKYRVTVATSDAIEQVIIFGGGALRLSARGLLEQIIAAEDEMREKYLK
ncbi:MAG: NYN domain-containing protein, partial [Lachnospiraceae bacterium]|nr:NYN domain-containing protein [Lachnospiraceae bacterium]